MSIPQSTNPPRGGPSRWVAILFFVFAAGVPLVQASMELSRGERVQCLELWGPISNDRLRVFEEELRNASFLRDDLLPYYQWLVTAITGHGNERATKGRDGWYYYAEDLESVTGPGYLDERVGGQAAIDAIVDFRDQLTARGIHLVLIPSLSKEMVDPQFLAPWTSHLTQTRNSDHDAFLAALDQQGLDVVRMDALLDEIRDEQGGGPLYLPRDTHWRPETMARFAEKLAPRLRAHLGESDTQAPFLTQRVDLEGEGDLVRMLRLPERPTLIEPMKLTVEQVIYIATGAPVASDPTSDVLLMGDSMTRVFSDSALGLGEGAGFGEHLALQLGHPVDVIALAGGSATATREALARRPGGLDGKRLVVWQFGVRMVAAGPDRWRKVALPPPGTGQNGSDEPDSTPSSSGDEPLRIRGRVTELTPIPEDFDYESFLAVTEYEVLEVLSGTWVPEEEDGPLWLAHVAMEDHELTDASRIEVGEVHEFTVELVDDHYDLEQVPWMDQTDAGFDLYVAMEWSRVQD